jgi:hypothetical protein
MVLDLKDANRLETLRPYSASDKVFWRLDNKPLEDLNQRDYDILKICTPARGFRPRGTRPAASVDVEVEIGVYVVGLIVYETILQTLTITATSAGTVRIDLLYINLTTGVAAIVAGAEAATFGVCVKPTLPSGICATPIAFLYVNETPTPFSEYIAVGTAGCIHDIRIPPGASLATLQSAYLGGSAVTIGAANPIILSGDNKDILKITSADTTTVRFAATESAAGVFLGMQTAHYLRLGANSTTYLEIKDTGVIETYNSAYFKSPSYCAKADANFYIAPDSATISALLYGRVAIGLSSGVTSNSKVCINEASTATTNSVLIITNNGRAAGLFVDQVANASSATSAVYFTQNNNFPILDLTKATSGDQECIKMTTSATHGLGISVNTHKWYWHTGTGGVPAPAIGDIIWNTTPTIGGGISPFVGWIYTGAVWSTFGAIS